jgi:2'-5' RNA ligase
MSPIRAFIAIELPPEIQTQLENVAKRLRAARASAVRWVSPQNIHLTLKFLGDTDPSKLTRLGEQLQIAAAGCQPVEITIAGLGAFPNNRQPLVIWVGVEIPAQIKNLQSSVEAAAEKIGCPVEQRPFSPHLTLGRVRKDASREEIAQISQALASVEAGELGRFMAAGFTLFRSDLRPNGPVYTPLAHFDFRRYS